MADVAIFGVCAGVDHRWLTPATGIAAGQACLCGAVTYAAVPVMREQPPPPAVDIVRPVRGCWCSACERAMTLASWDGTFRDDRVKPQHDLDARRADRCAAVAHAARMQTGARWLNARPTGAEPVPVIVRGSVVSRDSYDAAAAVVAREVIRRGPPRVGEPLL